MRQLSEDVAGGVGGSGAPQARRSRRAIVADLFCGAGSLSMGANDALIELGYRPEFVAVNHWPVAIETYRRNHQGARAHCVTLDAAFPAQLVPEGRLDLLMAGIECTYFSRARGGKPVNDQQRMSAWHVVRWCTELRVKRLLLENVPEFVDWGPVDPRTGKPLRSRKGEYFRAWWEALKAIGFKRLEYRVLNCADYGDATTRERLFILGWIWDEPLPWPHPTHSRSGNLFGAAPWRSAREIIDWSIPGRSIFARKRPLAPKTLARIAAGIVKFRWPEPFIVVLRQHCEARGIDLPLPTITAGGTHLGLVQPFVTRTDMHKSNAACIRGADEPLATITTGGGFGVVSPFVLSQASCGAPRSVQEPLPTVTTGGNGGAHALIAPYYGSGSGESCCSVDQPLPTATGKARFGLVMPVTHNCGGNRARSVEEPLPTITTARRGELAFITAGQQYDILFRMLEPHELAAAMSISTPESPYHFTGNKTEVVKQIGQAVPRRTGRALAHALMGARTDAAAEPTTELT